MGFLAAKKLLDESGVDPSTIDALLLCTQCPDYYLPSAACILQHNLGLGKHVAAFDFNLGCSGFVYGLNLARVLIAAGDARNVLLVTTDTIAKIVNKKDRTVRMLFGDAAAATLISQSETNDLGPFVLGSDGKGSKNLIVPSGGLRLPRSPETAVETTDKAGCIRSQNDLFMDGPEIFTFAIGTVPKNINAVLAKSGETIEQVNWFVYHQANKYMLEYLAKKSRIPMEKMAMSLEDIGNTSSASIPIALRRYAQDGKIQPGHRVLLAGFGVGYSWGACMVTWR